MKLDILLPTNLSEIPLSRYQEFIAMKEKSNDEEFIAQKMIQIFCGMKLGEVAKIKMKHLNELIAHFTKVFSEKPQLIRKFKIKNIEFGFIPKFDDISFGEYVDIENYMKDWKTYHKALSSSFFLSSLGIELLKATQTYLQKELKKMKKDLTNSAKEQILDVPGVGMEVSMDWLTETLQSLMKLQSTSLLNVLPISPSKNKNTKSKPEKLNNK